MMVLLGAIPFFSALFQVLPGGVLHGATGLMFAMIAVAGFRILSMQANRNHAYRMLAGYTVLAFLLTQLPGVLAIVDVQVPGYLAMLLNFPVASGALIAMIWEWGFPVETQTN